MQNGPVRDSAFDIDVAMTSYNKLSSFARRDVGFYPWYPPLDKLINTVWGAAPTYEVAIRIEVEFNSPDGTVEAKVVATADFPQGSIYEGQYTYLQLKGYIVLYRATARCI
jgi:hypothetical protein